MQIHFYLQLDLPSFTTAFKKALKDLEEADSLSDAVKRNRFKLFYETYGTHFITWVDFAFFAQLESN